jgi:hypothetical protein
MTTTPITLHTWIKALAFNRVRDLLDHLAEPAPQWTVLTAACKLIHRTALLQLQDHCLWVIFDPFPEAQLLKPYCAWVKAVDFVIPWLNHLRLRLAIADQPLATTSPEYEMRKLLCEYAYGRNNWRGIGSFTGRGHQFARSERRTDNGERIFGTYRLEQLN